MNYELFYYAPGGKIGNNAPSVEQPRGSESIRPLTSRQLEILMLLGKGFYYKEISEKLGISLQTVKNHVAKDDAIFQRLNVRSTTGAVITAVKEGMLNLDELAKRYDIDIVATCTRRQHEILAAMVENPKEVSNKFLTEKFVVEESTIKNQMGSLMRKLQVPNRTAAAVVYMAWQRKIDEASNE